MRKFKNLSLFAATLSFALFTGLAHGFNFDFDDFDFGDDDDDRYPGWIEAPGQPAPKYGWYPQMRSFDRSRMVYYRQRQMQQLAAAMTRLQKQIAGRDEFDRKHAIQLANYIEGESGDELLRNYHPGSVMDDQSRTTRALWGNEDMFKAAAVKTQEAAKALAAELAKEPTKEEGAVFLRAKRAGPDEGAETAAVSPQLKNKFDALSNACNSCHRSFRSQYR